MAAMHQAVRAAVTRVCGLLVPLSALALGVAPLTPAGAVAPQAPTNVVVVFLRSVPRAPGEGPGPSAGGLSPGPGAGAAPGGTVTRPLPYRVELRVGEEQAGAEEQAKAGEQGTAGEQGGQAEAWGQRVADQAAVVLAELVCGQRLRPSGSEREADNVFKAAARRGKPTGVATVGPRTGAKRLIELLDLTEPAGAVGKIWAEDGAVEAGESVARAYRALAEASRASGHPEPGFLLAVDVCGDEGVWAGAVRPAVEHAERDRVTMVVVVSLTQEDLARGTLRVEAFGPGAARLTDLLRPAATQGAGGSGASPIARMASHTDFAAALARVGYFGPLIAPRTTV